MSWKVIKPIPFNPFKINGVEYKNSLELVMRIEELEKENTELKRIVKMVAMINTGIYTNEGIKAIYEEAERFIKEIEK